MSNLKTLFKIVLINNFGLNYFNKDLRGGAQKKYSMMFLVKIMVGMLLGAMVVVYSIGLGLLLKEAGSLEILPLIGCVFVALISIIMSVNTIQGILFSKGDNDLLMSLPISDKEIFLSKIFVVLIINYLITALVLFSTGIVYSVLAAEFSVVYYIMLVISVLIMPLIPIIVAAAIAMIFSWIASKTKFQNIIVILINLILIVGFVVLGIKGTGINVDISNFSPSDLSGLSIGEMGKIYPLAIFYTRALVYGNIIEFLKLIALSVIPFIIFVWIFSRNFRSIASKLGESYRRADYKFHKMKVRSKISAVFKKEISVYFQTPIYVFNTSFGVILLIILSIASIFINKGKIESYAGLVVPGINSKLIIVAGILIISIFAIGLSCTTYASISLEGKRFWIMKSLPIDPWEMMKGKILFNLMLTVPVGVVSNILFYLSFGFEIKYLFIMLIICVTYSLLSAVMGILLNLLFPKMEWVTEVEPVKQSVAIIFSALLSIVAVILSAGVVYLLKFDYIAFILIEIVMLALLGIVYISVRSIGDKKLMKL